MVTSSTRTSTRYSSIGARCSLTSSSTPPDRLTSVFIVSSFASSKAGLFPAGDHNASRKRSLPLSASNVGDHILTVIFIIFFSLFSGDFRQL